MATSRQAGPCVVAPSVQGAPTRFALSILAFRGDELVEVFGISGNPVRHALYVTRTPADHYGIPRPEGTRDARTTRILGRRSRGDALDPSNEMLQLVRRGEIATQTIGRRRIVPRESLVNFLAADT